MAKVIDITDKLTFDGNPCLMIKGAKLEVNADAPTLLKVMGLFGDFESKQPGPKEIMEAYNLMFPEKSRKEIEKMKPMFSDLLVIIQAAVSLATGDVSQGE